MPKKQSASASEQIKQLFSYLTVKDKKQLIFVNALSLLSGLAEIISLGIIVPFVTVIISPDKLDKVNFIQQIKTLLNIENSADLLPYITACLCLIAISATLLRIASVWFIAHTSQTIGKDFEIKIFKTIISLPYEKHIRSHSGEFISLIEQSKLISGSLMHINSAINAIFVSICIVITLLLIAPVITLSCLIILGSAFIITSLISRKKLTKNSQQAIQNKTRRNVIAQESFNGIRDIILDSGHHFYAKEFKRCVKTISHITVSNEIYKNSPKILIENLALIFIALLAFAIATKQNIADFLPLFAAMAIGLQKLLPLMQKIHVASSFFKTESFSLDLVFTALRDLEKHDFEHTKQNNDNTITFEHKFSIDHIDFAYDKNSPLILNNLTLEINKKDKIGVIGHTGSGKSTLLDIIMGLIPATKGQLIADNTPITAKNMDAWQQNISHVSQKIFIANKTIAENIALNTHSEEIDMDRVHYAAKIAQADDFIKKTENGYQTILSEQGASLSGGQCQRIGIARAIYKNRPILILDEATSALDTNTEEKIIQSLTEHCKDITVIIVSHRPSILKHCNHIYEIKDKNLSTINFKDINIPQTTNL